jgi:hypothetical protein
MFKNFFNKLKEEVFEPDVTIQKFKPFFTTVDKEIHEGHTYGWAIKERISCSIPEYIMIDINSRGYMKDSNDIMYPLTNIISIDWKLLDEKIVQDVYDRYHLYLTPEEEKNIEFLNMRG